MYKECKTRDCKIEASLSTLMHTYIQKQCLTTDYGILRDDISDIMEQRYAITNTGLLSNSTGLK